MTSPLCLRRLLSILCVLVAACSTTGRRPSGGGDRTKGGVMHYSCEIANGGSRICAEYEWTGAAAVGASYEMACASAGGTEGTTCDEDGALGRCELDATASGVTITTTTYYYDGTVAVLEQACDAGNGAWHGGGSGGGSSGTKDGDADGYTPDEGDCDDTTPLVNPGATEIAKNKIDDDCNGEVDEIDSACEAALVGKTDAMSLAHALGLCDLDVLQAAKLVGPSDKRARAVVESFGVIVPESGDAMLVLSSGFALTPGSAGFVSPESGTSLATTNTAPNPAPDLPTKYGCGQTQPSTVNDYTEVELTLRVPDNANSFSFRSQFLSAEYPEFVCTSFNDAFIVLLDDGVSSERNLVYDDGGNPISVNNGFFRVCENYDAKPETQNCTRPISELAGTGFETVEAWDDTPVGGSTGWLKTSAPVTPGSEIKLRFIIFDAGDHIYDSTVLIDDFVWSSETIDGPITIG